jgi:hypothetical protein
MKTKSMNVPRNALYFSAGTKGGTVAGKRIELLASSGKPFKHWHWRRLALDLKGLRINKSRLPILWSHDRNRPLGFFNREDVRLNGQLKVLGTLVDTPSAREFANLAEQGMPLEASIYAIPTQVEHVPDGESALVNGHQLVGPGNVWRSFELREVSAAMFGWDSETSASVHEFANNETLAFDVEVIESDEDSKLAEHLYLLSRPSGVVGEVSDQSELTAYEESIVDELLAACGEE